MGRRRRGPLPRGGRKKLGKVVEVGRIGLRGRGTCDIWVGMERCASAGCRPRAPHAAPWLALALALSAGLASTALAQAPSFALIAPPQGFSTSLITGLSSDGRTAAGQTETGSAFYWTLDGGLVQPPLGQCNGISGDGRVVVGAHGITAGTWSQAGGSRDLGTLSGYPFAAAYDASYDGSVVVGWCQATPFDNSGQAFRWTASGGMQGFGPGTKLFAVSGDGSAVVGQVGTAPNGFAWSQQGGYQPLIGLGGSAKSSATAVNSDGSIIVGTSGTTNRPTRWNRSGVPTELLPQDLTKVLHPHGVSEDGSVVPGQVQDDQGNLYAGVWTAGTGIISLADYLTSNGVTMPTGTYLLNCTSVSADGRTFAGYTGHPNGTGPSVGFIATIPAPSSLAVVGIGALMAARRRR